MNHMKKVAEILGVEMGEKFKVETINGVEYDDLYSICKEGLYDHTEQYYTNSLLFSIIYGSSKIIKLPWIPEKSEEYYYYSNEYGIGKANFSGATFDIMAVISGNCFRTREEAEEHRDEIMAKFKEFM